MIFNFKPRILMTLLLVFVAITLIACFENQEIANAPDKPVVPLTVKPDKGTANDACDLPVLYASLCKYVDKTLTSDIPDNFGPSSSRLYDVNLNMPLHHFVTRDHGRFPLQELLGFANAGNSDAMVILAEAFKNEDWQKYWLSKAGAKGNLYARRKTINNRIMGLHKNGELTDEIGGKLQKDRMMVSLTTGIELLQMSLGLKARSDIECIISETLYEDWDQSELSELARSLDKSTQRKLKRAVPPVKLLAEKGNDCAIFSMVLRAMEIQNTEYTLPILLKLPPNSTVSEMAAHCFAGVEDYKSKYVCRNVDKDFDLAIRYFEQYLDLEEEEFKSEIQGVPLRLHPKHRTEKWDIFINLLSEEHKSNDTIKFRIHVAKKYKNKSTVHTLAALSDPFLNSKSEDLSKVEFFRIFEYSKKFEEFQKDETSFHPLKDYLSALYDDCDKLQKDGPIFHESCVNRRKPHIDRVKNLSVFEAQTLREQTIKAAQEYMFSEHNICVHKWLIKCPVKEAASSNLNVAVEEYFDSVYALFSQQDDYEHFIEEFTPPTQKVNRTFENLYFSYLSENLYPLRSLPKDEMLSIACPGNIETGAQRSLKNAGNATIHEDYPGYWHKYEECRAFSKGFGATYKIELKKNLDNGSIYSAIALGYLEPDLEFISNNELNYYFPQEYHVALIKPKGHKNPDIGKKPPWFKTILEKYSIE